MDPRFSYWTAVFAEDEAAPAPLPTVPAPADDTPPPATVDQFVRRFRAHQRGVALHAARHADDGIPLREVDGYIIID